MCMYWPWEWACAGNAVRPPCSWKLTNDHATHQDWASRRAAAAVSPTEEDKCVRSHFPIGPSLLAPSAVVKRLLLHLCWSDWRSRVINQKQRYVLPNLTRWHKMERGCVNRRERGTVRGAFSQFHSTSCTVLKGQCWRFCHCQQKRHYGSATWSSSGVSPSSHLFSLWADISSLMHGCLHINASESLPPPTNQSTCMTSVTNSNNYHNRKNT